MSAWRAAAIERLPELKKTIESAESVMGLWIEIWLAFEKSYEHEPHDDSFIDRVYSYADWCYRAPRRPDPGHDPSTAAAVCFYEHLPQKAAIREDMPKWVSHAQVLSHPDVFGYHIGRHEYMKLLAFLERKRHLFKLRSNG